MRDKFSVVDDPVPDGIEPVHRWGFFLDDLPEQVGGGFSTGEFLLRSDGALLRRGVPGGDARDDTSWQAGPWMEFHRFPAGSTEGQARAWLGALDYQLGDPAPVPVDRMSSAPVLGMPDLASVEQAPIDVGVAGASARREEQRRKTKRETATKAQFGARLGGIIHAIRGDPQSTRAWGQGARGEEALAAALTGLADVVVLHDRRVPRTKGNIDHVVIAPAGVFVVDAKLRKGLIKVRDRGGLFRSDKRLYVGRRDCSELADNMGWQVEAVAGALESLGLDVAVVTPVLCFVDGDWPLFFRADSFRGVWLDGLRSLRKRITGVQVLDADQISRLASALATALPPK